jgi:(2Fe-2S) ferredoxin
MPSEDVEIYVCLNVDCKSRGSQAVLDRLTERLADAGLDHVVPEPYLCFSACQRGPNVVIPSKRCWLSGVATEDVEDIITFLQGGAEPTRLTASNDPRLHKLIFDIMDAGLRPGRGDFFG